LYLEKDASGGEVGAPRNPMANARRVSFSGAPRVRIRVMCEIIHRALQVRELLVLQCQRMDFFLSFFVIS